jgi:flagellar export protein FliJ
VKSRRDRIERVLRVRRLEEEVARERFIACEQVARQADELADGISAEIARAQEQLGETRVQSLIPPEDLLSAQSTLESLDDTLAEQRRRTQELQLEADGMRATWELARQEMRALERLDEQLASAERGDQARREAREMDEEAVRRGHSGPVLDEPPGPSSPDRFLADERAARPPEADKQ